MLVALALDGEVKVESRVAVVAKVFTVFFNCLVESAVDGVKLGSNTGTSFLGTAVATTLEFVHRSLVDGCEDVGSGNLSVVIASVVETISDFGLECIDVGRDGTLISARLKEASRS